MFTRIKVKLSERVVLFQSGLPLRALAPGRYTLLRRHLTEQFRRSYGIGPKECARVIRFERARALLGSGRRPTLAEVAAACGYADQSHLTRDWKRFAGSTPSAWLADELPYVQDSPVDL